MSYIALLRRHLRSGVQAQENVGEELRKSASSERIKFPEETPVKEIY